YSLKALSNTNHGTRRCRMQRKDRPGFTLIELLVVIAVIAIISAILFPTFAQAREKARAAACLSNLHQIAIACELHSQAYDETFPWSPAGKILHRTGRFSDCIDFYYAPPWIVLLQPYLKSREVFRCPSYPGLVQPSGWWDMTAYQGSGYGLNVRVIGDYCRPHT